MPSSSNSLRDGLDNQLLRAEEAAPDEDATESADVERHRSSLIIAKDIELHHLLIA
jgi:hypothetical protein